MADPYVRATGSAGHDDGAFLVGVDYDTVTVGPYRMSAAQCEDFGRLFIAACWQAGANAKAMREEADQSEADSIGAWRPEEDADATA